ncbi:2-amino-4-hydroxy-6-hydroxymethyldihydropteridine diphosphokinase [Cerasicoccus frondis]|uniref:2-amino-4-hydroxy-6- hydroxymethyldihydropteridine diphosphokinase n=1 Tax=Cerasicoccus frondis TaxID=490090 RepID=UPI0028526A85|nr:2-amino-4-hydroxy-6-hydroxymethyldihydropteridine diphosphokinase [Cerasicoccus frondis]
MARAYIGLGGNVGDRAAALQHALAEFEQAHGIQSVRSSSFFETKPVGPIEQADFLNAVIEIETSLSPHELLALGQQIEQSCGRTRDVHWGPRTLDIDLLAFGQSKISTAELTLPHPEATKRAFVLAPWAELAPHFVIDGKSIAEHLEEVGCEGVRKFDCC